jgi:hypothetical protein
MRTLSFVLAAVLAGLSGCAFAQEDEQSEPVDPLAQCLEVGQQRYERCTSDADSDAADCQAEHDSYDAQCSELYQQ